jgi:hypothetical protein
VRGVDTNRGCPRRDVDGHLANRTAGALADRFGPAVVDFPGATADSWPFRSNAPTSSPASDGDDETVFGAHEVDVIPPVQHVLVHVRENNPRTTDPVPILPQRLVIKVIGDLLLKEVRLADEDIGPVCHVDECVGPGAITRVGDALPPVLQSERVWWRGARVLDRVGRYRGRSDGGRLSLGSSRKSTVNRRDARTEPGKSTSIACSTRR